MTINLKHRHVALTEAIKAYAQQKVEALTKYAGLIRHADVEVGKSSTHHKNGNVYVCKAVFDLENGQVLRINREAKDLYKAIDKVHDLAREALTKLHRVQVEDRLATVS